MKTKVTVVSGDLTKIPCDAIITAINSSGMWFGGIDGAIQRAAGNRFHNQAAQVLPLRHGATVVAKSNGVGHGGKFRNVIFIIDDLKGPLSEVIPDPFDMPPVVASTFITERLPNEAFSFLENDIFLHNV